MNDRSMARRVRFICMTNRSGSSWLCHMLNSTGVAGFVGEIRQKDQPAKEWREKRDVDPYCVKLNWHMMQRVWPLMTPGEAAGARYVFLIRRDKWRQAISQYRARASGVWHLWAGKPIPARHNQVPFDAGAIRSIRNNLIAQDQQWGAWFRKRGIRPLKLYYEDLCRAPVATTRLVLQYFGLPSGGPINMYTLLVSRDELTEEWMRLLKEEAHEPSPAAPAV